MALKSSRKSVDAIILMMARYGWFGAARYLDEDVEEAQMEDE